MVRIRIGSTECTKCFFFDMIIITFNKRKHTNDTNSEHYLQTEIKT